VTARRALLPILVLLGALVAVPATHASSGKIAVGIADGASASGLAELIHETTGGAVDTTLADMGALVVSVGAVDEAATELATVPGTTYVEPLQQTRTLSYQPTDPLVFYQWYLTSIHAFDYWDALPALAPVRVAVVDSGIDASHPEFTSGRIAATKSFVGGKATEDTVGHGTIVAGEIAAAIDNAEGIAGVGFPVELMVAKVVQPSGTISVQDEAEAIRWAVDNGALVVNLSLGGVRDPNDPQRDEYSQLEQDAVDYAYRNGAIVVASTGNTSPGPYRYASYPAALPHVLGVSAYDQSERTPAFSNRDTVYNDLTAPGVGILSTFPVDLTDPACGWPGYNFCARAPYASLASGSGTSFSAPLVSAAAALLLAQTNSRLSQSQVMTLLELSARDIGAGGRDPATGYGALDIASALAAAVALPPPADRYETNDDAGSDAWTLYGSRATLNATIDYFDDPSDVYRVYLRAHRRLTASLTGPKGTTPTLVLWRAGTKHVTPITLLALRSGSVIAHHRSRNPRLNLQVSRSGWYFLEVKAPKGKRGAYTLTITK
jgi:subtilisin family serine protease